MTATPTRMVSNRRKVNYFQAVKSDTDDGAGVWCSRLGKYVKPAGWVDGVTQEECDCPPGKPKYQSEPIGLGEVDGY